MSAASPPVEQKKPIGKISRQKICTLNITGQRYWHIVGGTILANMHLRFTFFAGNALAKLF
jgi:hypothetical protein